MIPYEKTVGKMGRIQGARVEGRGARDTCRVSRGEGQRGDQD